MDLYAYANMSNIDYLLEANNISVPRLRGLRLMSEEEPLTREDINQAINDYGLDKCEDVITCRRYGHGVRVYEYSSKTRNLIKKYFIMDDKKNRTGIRWENVHGIRRRRFKLALKTAKKKVEKSIATFNKYCGRDDVLYIHARIGSHSWTANHANEVKKEPWFIEMIDDYWDNSYCDIYARIDPGTVKHNE